MILHNLVTFLVVLLLYPLPIQGTNQPPAPPPDFCKSTLRRGIENCKNKEFKLGMLACASLCAKNPLDTRHDSLVKF